MGIKYNLFVFKFWRQVSIGTQVQCLPWIASKCGVMQGVETIVVGQSHVGTILQQQRQHVIALLRYRIMKWRVAFRVL